MYLVVPDVQPKEMAKMFSASPAKHIRAEAFERFLENPWLKSALELDGLPGFFDLFPRSPEFRNLHQIVPCKSSLIAWGLDEEAADIVHQADECEHLSITDITLGFLILSNGLEEDWQVTDEGWPADKPIDKLFFSSLTRLRAERRGLAWQGISDYPIIFADDPDNIQRYIPGIQENRMLVFHATSWSSAANIENYIDPSANYGRVLDFGTGFYCTSESDYCVWWSRRPFNDRILNCPAILVFSLPKNYPILCNRKILFGADWNRIIQKTRGDKQKYEGPEDILEGAVCRDVSKVNCCMNPPEPSSADQICFRSPKATSLLKHERTICFRKKNI